MTTNLSPSQICIDHGLDSLAELVRYCEAEVSRRTLYEWAKYRPETFQMLVVGAVAKKKLLAKKYRSYNKRNANASTPNL